MNHADRKALYECGPCQVCFCEECVQIFRAGTFNTFFCPQCQGQCQEIESNDQAGTFKPQAPAPKPQPEIKKPDSGLNEESSSWPVLSQTVVDTKTQGSPEATFSAHLGDSVDEIQKIPEKQPEEPPSVQPAAYVLKVIQSPSLKLFFSNVFKKPGETFTDSLYLLRQSTPFRVRFLFMGICFMAGAILCRFFSPVFPNHVSLGATFSEWVIFSGLFAFGICTTENKLSCVYLSVFVLGMESFFIFIRNFFIYAFLFFSLEWVGLITGTLILIVKLNFYSRLLTRGLSCDWLSVLLTLATATMGSLFITTIVIKSLS
ncbi:MAG: hypothetical protein JW774_09260 [Candidatus Aureabacteria bacterium]|nr:hypothetical protein [Candidatus Auribacterota bacterium]